MSLLGLQHKLLLISSCLFTQTHLLLILLLQHGSRSFFFIELCLQCTELRLKSLAILLMILTFPANVPYFNFKFIALLFVSPGIRKLMLQLFKLLAV